MTINKANKLTSTRVSVPPFNKNIYSSYTNSSYVHMFVKDMTLDFAISFSQLSSSRDFFNITSENDKLKNLLLYLEQDFLRYKFSDLLSNTMLYLMLYGKCFIEIELNFNEENELKAISFHPFNSYFNYSIRGETTFFSTDSNGKRRIWTIPKDRFIKFDLEDLDIKRNYFRKIIKGLSHYGMPDFNMISKNQIPFEDWKKNQSLKMMELLNDTYWSARGLHNEYITEVYLLYRTFKHKKFRKTFLDYFIIQFNNALKKLGEKYDFDGEISCSPYMPASEEDIKKLRFGKINCKQMGDLLFK